MRRQRAEIDTHLVEEDGGRVLSSTGNEREHAIGQGVRANGKHNKGCRKAVDASECG